jgi:hypothetical protein
MDKKSFKKQSREDSQTKIEDELIAPYVIYFDGSTYTVVKPKEKSIDENIGYYSRLNSALASIARLLSNTKTTQTLTEHINTFNNIVLNINNKFNI